MDWAIRDAELIGALNVQLEAYPRWGFWKYFERLRTLGHGWNHKRVCRVYCDLDLNQPRRTKKRLPERERIPLWVPERPNQVWSADFMSDALYRGPRFRTFNVIDDFNREGLAIEIDTSLRAARILRVLDRLRDERGLPDMLTVDNGPEFMSQLLIDWAQEKKVLIQYIQPGNPERVCGIFQRQLPGRLSEPAVVSRSDRCPAHHRGMANPLQLGSSTQRARLSAARTIRGAGRLIL